MNKLIVWYKKILDIFTIPKKTEPNTDSIKYENSVSFVIDEWNRFIIRIGIDNKNSSSCEAFGKMLFFLNNGSYEQNILNIMVDMSKKNPDQAKYVEAAMISWAASINEQINRESLIGPQVRPTEVFISKK